MKSKKSKMKVVKTKDGKKKKVPDKTLDLKKNTALFKAIQIGISIKNACYIAGISYKTYLNHYEKDPEFRDLVDKAEAMSELFAVKHLNKLIKDGNVKAIIFFLERRHSQQWSQTIKTINEETKPKEFNTEELEKLKKYSYLALTELQNDIYKN